jgi:hypothetical protein
MCEEAKGRWLAADEARWLRLPLPRKACASSRMMPVLWERMGRAAGTMGFWETCTCCTCCTCCTSLRPRRASRRLPHCDEAARCPRYKDCTCKGSAPVIAAHLHAPIESVPLLVLVRFRCMGFSPLPFLPSVPTTTPPCTSQLPKFSCDGGCHDKSYTQRSQPRSVWPIRLVRAQEPVGAIVVPEHNIRPPRKPLVALPAAPLRRECDSSFAHCLNFDRAAVSDNIAAPRHAGSCPIFPHHLSAVRISSTSTLSKIRKIRLGKINRADPVQYKVSQASCIPILARTTSILSQHHRRSSSSNSSSSSAPELAHFPRRHSFTNPPR